MDTSGYQLSVLEDIEFLWDDLDLNMDMDAVFQPGMDILFFPSFFNDLRSVEWLKTRIVGWRAKQGEQSFSSMKNSVQETVPTPFVDEKLPNWNKDWEISPLC